MIEGVHLFFVVVFVFFKLLALESGKKVQKLETVMVLGPQRVLVSVYIEG